MKIFGQQQRERNGINGKGGEKKKALQGAAANLLKIQYLAHLAGAFVRLPQDDSSYYRRHCLWYNYTKSQHKKDQV